MYISAFVVAWITMLSDYVRSQAITYTFVKECSYLKSTEGQYNAYIIDDKICCFCGKGTEWKGDCDSSRPSTTICNACHWNEDNVDDRYFMDYEPHIQKQCFGVDLKNCIAPKIYIKGSATERPRCVCPSGTKEVGSQRCVLESSKETTLQPGKDLTHSKNADHPPEPVSPSKTEMTTQKLQETPTKNQAPKSVPYGLYIGISVGVILLIIIIIILIAVLIARYKSNKPRASATSTQASYSQQDSPDLGVSTSHTGLLPTRVRDISDKGHQNVASNCDYQIIKESSQAQTMASPEPRPTVSRMDVEYSNRELLQNDPLLNDESIEVDLQRRYLHHDQHAEQNDLHLVHILQSQPQHSQGATDEVRVQIGDRGLTVVEVQRNYAIAMDVANKWGVKLRKNEALAIFRHIISEHDCDNDLQDVYDEHSNSTKELYYQLMKYAKTQLGHKLTPEFLVEKLSSLDTPLQSAIDIVISCQNFFFNMEAMETA